jgi:hypothetical protein
MVRSESGLTDQDLAKLESLAASIRSEGFTCHKVFGSFDPAERIYLFGSDRKDLLVIGQKLGTRFTTKLADVSELINVQK